MGADFGAAEVLQRTGAMKAKPRCFPDRFGCWRSTRTSSETSLVLVELVSVRIPVTD